MADRVQMHPHGFSSNGPVALFYRPDDRLMFGKNYGEMTVAVPDRHAVCPNDGAADRLQRIEQAAQGRMSPRRSRYAADFRPFLQPLSVAILFGAWEYGGQVPISPAVPTFADTFAAFLDMLGDGTLLKAFWVTLQPLAVGLLISGIIGVTAGVAMGLNRLTEWFGLPIFIVLQSAPLTALVPVIMILFG